MNNRPNVAIELIKVSLKHTKSILINRLLAFTFFLVVSFIIYRFLPFEEVFYTGAFFIFIADRYITKVRPKLFKTYQSSFLASNLPLSELDLFLLNLYNRFVDNILIFPLASFLILIFAFNEITGPLFFIYLFITTIHLFVLSSLPLKYRIMDRDLRATNHTFAELLKKAFHFFLISIFMLLVTLSIVGFVVFFQVAPIFQKFDLLKLPHLLIGVDILAIIFVLKTTKTKNEHEENKNKARSWKYTYFNFSKAIAIAFVVLLASTALNYTNISKNVYTANFFNTIGLYSSKELTNLREQDIIGLKFNMNSNSHYSWMQKKEVLKYSIKQDKLEILKFILGNNIVDWDSSYCKILGIKECNASIVLRASVSSVSESISKYLISNTRYEASDRAIDKSLRRYTKTCKRDVINSIIKFRYSDKISLLVKEESFMKFLFNKGHSNECKKILIHSLIK